MKALDLFGNMTETDSKPARGKHQIFRAREQYREGTKERSCKTCMHLVRKEYSKVYYNCNLSGVGNSESADIRLKMVCNKYVKEQE